MTTETVEVEEPHLSWDTCDLAQFQANFLKEEDPELSDDAAFQQASEDHDLFAWEWENLCDALTEWMNEVNPDSLEWRALVENFGWREQDGHTDPFTAEKGADLLRHILPNTDNTFMIYKRDGQLAINNAHHDSPYWKEWYYIKPVTEDEDDDDSGDQLAPGGCSEAA